MTEETDQTKESEKEIKEDVTKVIAESKGSRNKLQQKVNEIQELIRRNRFAERIEEALKEDKDK
jgi:hypothetical protein